MGRTNIFAALATLITLAVSAFGAGASYPSATVRLICWSSAGSPLDVMMRELGKQLADILGQTFVVENGRAARVQPPWPR